MRAAIKMRRSGMLLLALAMVLFLTPTGIAAEENVISEARNGVVRIFAYDPESGKLSYLPGADIQVPGPLCLI